MKPFNNVIVSATEPKNKANIWFKHGKNLFNSIIEQGGISDTGDDNAGNNRLRTQGYIFLKKGTYTLSFTGLEYSGGYLYNTDGTFNKLLWAWTTGNKTFTIENDSLMRFTFRKSDNAEITPDVVKNIQIEVGSEATEYEAPVEDDIFVNNNGVYNSVLNRKNAISLGIKEQVNITQQGLRILVPMDNLSVKVGETFELLSDGTIKILKNTIIFAFAQTQLIINDTDTGRLYIEKNGDGICAEEGKGTKAYQAMGIFNVNVGDIIRVTVVNVTAGRGNTGTTVSFNHLDMYEI